MKYDPIMCMMVPNSVKTKDGLDDPEKNAGYEMKKEGQYFKIYKNGKLIAMKSTEEEARREASRHRAANDSAVNEYEIHYTVSGKSDVMVGSGKGSTEAEAKADFMKYHKSENPKITSVKFYKKVSDESALDKAIKACDEKVSRRNVTTSSIAFEEIKKMTGIIPENVKQKGDTMEFYHSGVKVAEWDMNNAEVKVFV